MKTSRAKEEISRYISVDVETAGPYPAEYALLSIGACRVVDPTETFYTELWPDRPKSEPRAMAIHGLTIQELVARGLKPADAIAGFADWLESILPGQQPIFVAFNAPFDWMFVNDYFQRYLGKNPFGYAALDIKAYYMGRFNVRWEDTKMVAVSGRFLDNRPLAHNALQDAQDQAELFLQMLEIDLTPSINGSESAQKES